MNSLISVITIILALAVIALAFALLKKGKDAPELLRQLESLRQAQEKIDRVLREELERARLAGESTAGSLRKEVVESMTLLSGNTTSALNQSLAGITDTLRQLHGSIGEVQALRTDVGDLRKIFHNVKSRGGWGEVQIESILEDLLTPSQYEKNFESKPGSGQRVEFAVRMPGPGNGAGHVWLPIDAKFPTEDYIRLVEHSAAGDVAAADASAKAIEACVRNCAKTIREKYVNPPRTTEVAILFLPSEGLYAEVLRRPGLNEQLQRDFRVMLAGPTNLFAILNCLSVGFRTIALEERSREIQQILGAVRREFENFKQAIEKSRKQANTVLNGISDVETRFRAIDRTLKTVDIATPAEAELLLGTGAVTLGEELEIIEEAERLS